MLFGEYLVLNGAKSLAFPLKFGQNLSVTASEKMHWESWSKNEKWLEIDFDISLNILSTNNQAAAETLQHLFRFIRIKNPELELCKDFRIDADFNLEWGLGSSSTLISLLGQWSNVSPYELLSQSFGGSGYDIACAVANGPICYQIVGSEKQVESIKLPFSITDKLLFIYLGNKQSSKEEIQIFEKVSITESHVIAMNKIVDTAIDSSSIEEFENLMIQSEDLLSPLIGHQKLKERIFADYKHEIKSLGAWGGDFFLASYRDLNEAKNYFEKKGLYTMFTYLELIK